MIRSAVTSSRSTSSRSCSASSATFRASKTSSTRCELPASDSSVMRRRQSLVYQAEERLTLATRCIG